MGKFVCKGLESEPEQCLNCPFDECRYDVIKTPKYKKFIKPYEHKIKRDYIIKREHFSKSGGYKVSYVVSYKQNYCNSTSTIDKAMKFTRDEVRIAARVVSKIVSDRTKISIIRKDEELERLKK